jgi:hypothetical protein
VNTARLQVAWAVVGLCATSARAADLRPEDAVRHIGETATVCGVVASTMFEATVQDQPTLLDLGKQAPEAVFTAVKSMEAIGQSSARPKPHSAASVSV